MLIQSSSRSQAHSTTAPNTLLKYADKFVLSPTQPRLRLTSTVHEPQPGQSEPGPTSTSQDEPGSGLARTSHNEPGQAMRATVRAKHAMVSDIELRRATASHASHASHASTREHESEEQRGGARPICRAGSDTRGKRNSRVPTLVPWSHYLLLDTTYSSGEL